MNMFNISHIINNIKQDIINADLNLVHPELKTWLFMGSPVLLISVILTYLYFVLGWGPKFMANRNPFQINGILIVYNSVNLILNFVVLSISLFLSSKYNYFERICNTDLPPEMSYTVSYFAWWYFIAKILDLMDTVFFVLRKKQNQVTLLHVYHHTIMPVSVWVGIHAMPGAQGVFISMINMFVHVIMYTYYLIAALGPEYRKYLWWKKYLTKIQLCQFVIVLIFLLYVIIADCNTPITLTYYCIINAVIFFYLFADFYKRTYAIGNNKKSK